MQDEEEYQQSTQQLRQQRPNPPETGTGQLPYQPRVRRIRPPGVQDQAEPYQYQSRTGQTAQDRDGQNPPGMLAMEDRIERFAEGTSRVSNYAKLDES